MSDQPRWPRGTPGGGHRPGPGPGRYRPTRAGRNRPGGRSGDWADRLDARLPPPSQPEQLVEQGVLPTDWAERLREVPPERIQEVVRRSRGLPPPAAPGPTGPVKQIAVDDLAGRVAEGGWQYFFAIGEDDYEGVWVDVAKLVPNKFAPDRVFFYGPDGQYMDTRMADAELFVRRRL